MKTTPSLTFEVHSFGRKYFQIPLNLVGGIAVYPT